MQHTPERLDSRTSESSSDSLEEHDRILHSLEPLELLHRWWIESRYAPFALSTIRQPCSPDAAPDVRYVNIADIDLATQRIFIFTSNDTRKAFQLAANPHVAGAFMPNPSRGNRHLRVYGRARAAPDTESERLWRNLSRSLQIGYLAVRFSEPPRTLAEQTARIASCNEAHAAAASLPRPPWTCAFCIEGIDRFDIVSGPAYPHLSRVVFERDADAKAWRRTRQTP